MNTGCLEPNHKSHIKDVSSGGQGPTLRSEVCFSIFKQSGVFNDAVIACQTKKCVCLILVKVLLYIKIFILPICLMLVVGGKERGKVQFSLSVKPVLKIIVIVSH